MNPLLKFDGLPDFAAIKPADLTSALESVLAENQQKIKALLTQENFTWDNFVEPIEIIDEKLAILWDTVSHLHAVDMETWRVAYQENLPKLIDYQTQLSQSVELFKAYEQVSLSNEFKYLNAAQQKVIEDELRDFKLSGVNLPEKEKKEYADLMQELGKLSTKFEENIMFATQGWSYHTEDEKELAGLPQFTIDLAKENSEKKNKTGWILTLDFPSYFAVVTYAKNRKLRETFYEAYTTRASDQGPCAGKWDNGPVINEILAKRQRLAEILGFQNYAELSLATKMLKKSEEVQKFLNDLVPVAYPKAKAEWVVLQEYAQQLDGITQLAPWDASFYREKLQQEKYKISEEELRIYFPVTQVISGLFNVVNRLYGISIREEKAPVWHHCVKFYSVYDAKDKVIGHFYFDLYTRPEKREGAWMAECKSRMHTKHFSQLPIAYLNCNFDPLVEGKEPQLTHDQVITLFHEFGHGLQHMLTVINYPSVAGTHGVPWDTVEVASQLLENWCWEREALDGIAKHFETHEPLPDKLYQRMIQARDFCSGMDLIRQVEFALFDFELHATYDKNNPPNVINFWRELRSHLAVVPAPDYNRFPNTFSHIFAGGYAAGYYSYLWAEVMSSDIFSKFKHEGIFNQKTAYDYLRLILSQGGVCDPLGSFFELMGRNPRVDAFLEQRGMMTEPAVVS